MGVESMARGLAKEQSQAKGNAKRAAGNKGNTENLTPAQRAKRDAAALAEKKARKEASRAETLAGDIDGSGAKAIADAEARKKKQRAKESSQCAKQLRNQAAKEANKSGFNK